MKKVLSLVSLSFSLGQVVPLNSPPGGPENFRRVFELASFAPFGHPNPVCFS